MKVAVKETTMVRPFQETPSERLWLSNSDLFAPRKHAVMVYFYRPINGGSSTKFFDANLLKDALSKALVPFYPAARRFTTDKNGRIEVDCKAEGVLFLAAETDSTLDELGDFRPGPKMRQLVPTVDCSGHISSYPLMMAQVTYFKCGGVSLGYAIHHTISDGISAFHLMKAWSEIARGLPISTPPFCDRTLLKARDPPKPTFNHTEYGPSPTISKNPTSESQTIVLSLTSDQLSTLKSKYRKCDGKNKFSTFEILAAHIWRSACRARGLSDDQATKLSFSMDGRSRLQPPLPQGYFGNVYFHNAITCLSGEILTEPLADTIERIRIALSKVGDSYIRSALDYLQLKNDVRPVHRGSPNLHISSWMRLPIHDADFGWGRPFFMGRAVSNSEGSAFLTPRAEEDGSLLVGVCLESIHMPLFDKLFCELFNCQEKLEVQTETRLLPTTSCVDNLRSRL